MVFGSVLPQIGQCSCRDFLRRQELFKSQANILDLGKNVPIVGMSQNPLSPCMLFVLLFDLFVLSSKIAVGRSELQTLNNVVRGPGAPRCRPIFERRTGSLRAGQERSSFTGTRLVENRPSGKSRFAEKWVDKTTLPFHKRQICACSLVSRSSSRIASYSSPPVINSVRSSVT